LVAIFENPELDFSKNRAEGDDLLEVCIRIFDEAFSRWSRGRARGNSILQPKCPASLPKSLTYIRPRVRRRRYLTPPAAAARSFSRLPLKLTKTQRYEGG